MAAKKKAASSSDSLQLAAIFPRSRNGNFTAYSYDAKRDAVVANNIIITAAGDDAAKATKLFNKKEGVIYTSGVWIKKEHKATLLKLLAKLK